MRFDMVTPDIPGVPRSSAALIQNRAAMEYYGDEPRKRNPERASALQRQIQIDSRKVGPMRAMTIVIPILALMSPVAAQDQGRNPKGGTLTPPPAAGNAPQAPVGHRQPTQGSLPPSVRKEEDTTGRRAVDDLGPVPQICRNC
jgi:hypothetical protein